MNKSRIETVAHAIVTADPRHDPRYGASRYAVPTIFPDGPDVPLASIGPATKCDIAAWTCYSYPDLCDQSPQDGEIQGSWYWRNAKAILALSDAEADLVFMGVVDGKYVADYAHETATQAAARLRALVYNQEKQNATTA